MFEWLRKAFRSNLTSLDDIGMDYSTPPKKLKEHGWSGTTVYNDNVQWIDYNPELVGQSALEIYERMRKSDASIRSILQVIKLPLLRATWSVVPGVEQPDETDVEIAEFCNKQLIRQQHRVDQWQQVLNHVLLMLDFGFTVFEKVWAVDDEGYYYLERLAPRHPTSIKDFEVDKFGLIENVIQSGKPETGGKDVKIPGRYAVVCTYNREADNYWGVSLLRYIYQNYFYKTELYRIDAIRLDRFGVGIPVASIAEGYNLKPSELAELKSLLKGLRSHERAYAIVPQQIELKIMTPETEHGGATGLMDAIDHHDVMMARSVLAQFLTMGQQKHGNYGTSQSWADMFLYALQSLALDISNQLGSQVIQELCDLNFDMEGRQYPKVTASTLEDTNLKEMAAAMYNLVLGQVITPDDELERHVRKLLGLPNMQEGFSRMERMEGSGIVVPSQPGVGEDPNAQQGNVTPGDTAPNIRGGGSKKQGGQQPDEPSPGTKPSTTPQRGPIRAPRDRG